MIWPSTQYRFSSHPELTHEVRKRGNAVPQLGVFLWSQRHSSQARGSVWAHAARQAEEHLCAYAAPALMQTEGCPRISVGLSHVSFNASLNYHVNGLLNGRTFERKKCNMGYQRDAVVPEPVWRPSGPCSCQSRCCLWCQRWTVPWTMTSDLDSSSSQRLWAQLAHM